MDTDGERKDFIEMKTTRIDDAVMLDRLDLLISHTNGQELSVLRGARRLLSKARGVRAVILQLYGPESGVVRLRDYDPARPVRWLLSRGFRVSLALHPGRVLRTPGSLRTYFAKPGSNHVVNVLAVPNPYRGLGLRRRPLAKRRAARPCLDLTAGEKPNSWAEVDGRVLRENLHIIRLTIGRMHMGAATEASPPIGAVLKANAYGHGAVQAGRVLASARIDALFVSDMEDALQLRDTAEVPSTLPIVLLYRAPDRGIACVLAAANITASVLSADWVKDALLWPACSSTLRLHLMVDTGLSREGLTVDEAVSAARVILDQWPRWSLDGLYTHWCCPYDLVEMTRSRREFNDVHGAVAYLRQQRTPRLASGGDFLVHASSSSTSLYGTDYDLLRLGGLLFGDPVSLVSVEGHRFTMPGPHRTLLWKSRIVELHRSRAGRRFARCFEGSGCLEAPLQDSDLLLGVVPVGGADFANDHVVSAASRERLPLLEKSIDSMLVVLPAGTRARREAAIGMEVLLCEEQCVQGLFNVPRHIPRFLVNDPSVEQVSFCQSKFGAVSQQSFEISADDTTVQGTRLGTSPRGKREHG